MKTKYLMGVLLGLIISTTTQAQVIIDKTTFISNLMQIFHHRNSSFDSLTVAGNKAGGGLEAKIKLPNADETYILNNGYHAGYAFKDSVQAIAFMKEAQALIAEATTTYNATARFEPKSNPRFLQFHIGNNEGFYTQPDVIQFFLRNAQSHNKPYVVFLIFDGRRPSFSYYVTAGNRLVNNEIEGLIKDIAFGKDSLLLQVKGKKIPDNSSTISSYKSKRTLRGYEATIYEENNFTQRRNTLQLVKNWTGKKDDEVFQKADSLIMNLKAALPDTYCYLMNNSEQKISFYPHPFNSQTLFPKPDAILEIYYGRAEKTQNAYYVWLNISRTETIKQVNKTLPTAATIVDTPYPFKGDNGKYGYKNSKNEVVVAPRYSEAVSFGEERARVALNGHYGFIDVKGKEIIPPKYDYVGLFFFNGIVTFKLNGKFGIVDKNGKELVPANKYDDVKIERLKGNEASQNKFILAKQYNKYGFIDSAGNELVPLKYDRASIVAPFRARAMLNGKEGLIDNTGKILIPLQYENISEYTSNKEILKTGVLRLTLNKKYGLADLNGKILLQPIYNNAVKDFSEGLTVVEQAGKCGYADKTGKVVIPLQYERAYQFSDGMATIYTNGKYGYINKLGKVVIPCQYAMAGSFVNGMAAVKNGVDTKYGYIDKTGKLVVPFKYDLALDFDIYGEAKVYIGNKWGKINSKGVVVTPITNESKDDGW